MPRFYKIMSAVVFLGFAMIPQSATGGIVDETVVLQSKESDGYAKLYNLTANISSSYAYVGKGYLVGWRFENMPLPRGVKILGAALELFCNQKESASLTLRYLGEASDDSGPFTTVMGDIANRPKTSAAVLDTPGPWTLWGWNRTASLQPIIQEIINRPGWRGGHALTLFADGSCSSAYRGIFTSERASDYSARLHVSYQLEQVEYDTDGDNVPDIVLYDRDGDGYFECPVGKTEYSGTLVVEHPLEIMGGSATRCETLFKGGAFVLTNGGKVISDLLSPIVSSAYPGLRGNDFQVVSRNYIFISYNGKILLGGNSTEDWDGDVYLETTRAGSEIILKEGASILGRHIELITSRGEINIRKNCQIVGNSHINFKALESGDIHLNRDVTISAASVDGECWVNFGVREGDVHMNRNIEINADVIDMSGVNGNIWDDGEIRIIGIRQGW